MGYAKCTFPVPLAYNDGRPVEPEFFDTLYRSLDRQFGGYTIEGVKTGSWHGQVEQSVHITVYVPPDRIDELREVVKEIGRRLDQKQMAFDVSPPTVELIDIDKRDQDKPEPR